MPHVILEISGNISNSISFEPLFQKIHYNLVERIGADISACKSRVQVHSNFHIAEGHSELAFANLEVRVMAGRTDEMLKTLGEVLLNLLDDYFNQQPTIKVSSSVNISVLEKEKYFKK